MNIFFYFYKNKSKSKTFFLDFLLRSYNLDLLL